MLFAFEYNHWWQALSGYRNTVNCCNPFTISRLYSNRSITSFSTSYNLYSRNNTYLEPSFIEVIYILLLNTILCYYILYQSKPVSNNLRILAFSSLVVVFAIISAL